MLDSQVINEIKRKFMIRYANPPEIEAERARIREMLATFDAYGLLSWNNMLGFPVEMEYADRIDSLMRIRDNIIDIVGGDLSAFGDKDYILKATWLKPSINGWNSVGQGEILRLDAGEGVSCKPEGTIGYWKLVRSFDNKYRDKCG